MSLLLHLCLGEEAADELLRVAHVLGHHLGPVDNLGLARTHGGRDLAREQCLAAAGRAVEQHAWLGHAARATAGVQLTPTTGSGLGFSSSLQQG